MGIEIVAEIGKNFVVSEQPEPLETLLERAKELIREAVKAGATTVKFQAHSVNDEIHPEAKLISPHFDQDRYEWVKRNTYPREFWQEIAGYCRELDIEFLCTPMSRGAVYLIEDFVDRYKIGSGDLTDFVMLDYIRDYGKPVIISTGMSSLQEIRKAYDFLREKVKDIMIMHCVSEYPCKLENLNLLTIPFLKKQFPEAKIGFSDHSLEVSTGAMAIVMGAEIIEKHFTLDRKSWGSDHQVSLTPNEFAQMVKEIKYVKSDIQRREVNKKGYIVEDTKDGSRLRKREKDEPLQPILKIPKQALGVETKFINEDEMKFRKVFRKGLFTGRDIKQGELIAREDIIALRPRGDAPKSEDYELYIDIIATRDFKKYEAIK